VSYHQDKDQDKALGQDKATIKEGVVTSLEANKKGVGGGKLIG